MIWPKLTAQKKNKNNPAYLQTYQLTAQPQVCFCVAADLDWKNEAPSHVWSTSHHHACFLYHKQKNYVEN